jgi:hypothetical protein
MRIFPHIPTSPSDSIVKEHGRRRAPAATRRAAASAKADRRCTDLLFAVTLRLTRVSVKKYLHILLHFAIHRPDWQALPEPI